MIALELTQLRALMARWSGSGREQRACDPANSVRTLTVQVFGWMDTSIVEPRRAVSCGAPNVSWQ
jgi:hypothetical protein